MNLIGDEIVLDVEIVPGREVIIRAKFEPSDGLPNGAGLIGYFIPQSPMNHARPVSLESEAVNCRVAAAIEVRWIPKILWLGPEGHLPEVPVSRFVVVRISHVINVRVLEEFAYNIAVNSASFDLY